jgi:hypothetical protein
VGGWIDGWVIFHKIRIAFFIAKNVNTEVGCIVFDTHYKRESNRCSGAMRVHSTSERKITTFDSDGLFVCECVCVCFIAFLIRLSLQSDPIIFRSFL